METFWFVAIAFMLAVFIVLDGFDFGTGIIYPFVARTDVERRLTLHAIGPVWNGNEVWLLAGGGLLFFAFPRAYASGFSGFYLALIIVLWLLMFRGLAIELRSHFDHPIWRPFWDVTFSFASLLLAIVFGATIGNLIRGVPLNADGYFFVPFWTDFFPEAEPGILDVFTVLKGILGATILSVHGAQYIAMKTEGNIYRRACRIAKIGGWIIVPLFLLNSLSNVSIQPILSQNYSDYPIGHIFPLMAATALITMIFCRHKAYDVGAFLASCLFILTGLGSVAWGYYPNLLLATTDPAHNLTIYNSATTSYGLKIGLVWFSPGFILVLGYTLYMYRAFWGKVSIASIENGH